MLYQRSERPQPPPNKPRAAGLVFWRRASAFRTSQSHHSDSVSRQKGGDASVKLSAIVPKKQKHSQGHSRPECLVATKTRLCLTGQQGVRGSRPVAPIGALLNRKCSTSNAARLLRLTLKRGVDGPAQITLSAPTPKSRHMLRARGAGLGRGILKRGQIRPGLGRGVKCQIIVRISQNITH